MQNASVNTAPSRPMRSMLGVFSSRLPASEDSSQRAPSPRKNTRLGRVRAAPRASDTGSSRGAMTAAPVAAAACRNSRRLCADAPLPVRRPMLLPLDADALTNRLGGQRDYRHRPLRVPGPAARIPAVDGDGGRLGVGVDA